MWLLSNPTEITVANEDKNITIHHDGNVIKEKDVGSALQEIENAVTEEQRQIIVNDIKEAEKLEQAGELYEEDGSCWVRVCTCCCDDILSDDDQENAAADNYRIYDASLDKKNIQLSDTHPKNNNNKLLKSVNSWITLPIETQ